MLDTEQMMRELRIVFPTLWMRPLRDFDAQTVRQIVLALADVRRPTVH